jgi:hypothetical protein
MDSDGEIYNLELNKVLEFGNGIGVMVKIAGNNMSKKHLQEMAMTHAQWDEAFQHPENKMITLFCLSDFLAEFAGYYLDKFGNVYSDKNKHFVKLLGDRNKFPKRSRDQITYILNGTSITRGDLIFFSTQINMREITITL